MGEGGRGEGGGRGEWGREGGREGRREGGKRRESGLWYYAVVISTVAITEGMKVTCCCTLTVLCVHVIM